MRFLALFGLISLAEMATFFWVESRIGLLWALGIAITTAIAGSFLVRRAGLSVLRRIRENVTSARLPGRELSDGAAVLVAGAFLISPGFLTDIAGFLLLIPSVRGLIYRRVSSRWLRRADIHTRGTGTGRSDPSLGPQWDQGEIIDLEDSDFE